MAFSGGSNRRKADDACMTARTSDGVQVIFCLAPWQIAPPRIVRRAL
jgi:hypothetical protein